MWMMVLFDLPTTERKDRKAASAFRNSLLDLGFEMAQYSVYVRFTSGKEAVEGLTTKVEAKLPPDGKVDILQFTDKQYENIISFRGKGREPEKTNPEQYVLF